MIDAVIPNKNEKEFIKMAEKLGIDTIYFLYAEPGNISFLQKETKVKLRIGIICEPKNARKYKGKYKTFCKAPEDQTMIREIIESNRPDYIFGLEFHKKKDFIHHRSSGLNHVLCAIMKEKNVGLCFSLSELLKTDSYNKARYIGRMMQNITFAQKYGFNTIISTLAENCWQMRNKKDISAIFSVFGMNGNMINNALDWEEK